MAITKAQRAALREKFGGRCAYCGLPLGEKWHADHIEAVERKLERVPDVSVYRLRSTGEFHKPHLDTLENMNPACPPCNLDKHSQSLDSWRDNIRRSLEMLERDSGTYRRAVRYGLLTLQPKPIVFFFETLKEPQ